ncbi:MAG: efflux RND transporter periplasmic adaptor subunit [Vicinamibacteria bacterium]
MRKNRMALMLLGMAAVVAALAGIKVRQFQAMAAQAASFQPPPEAVTTVVATQENWPATLQAIGSVAAVQGVTVSADLPGLVSELSFDSGRVVAAGEILARLDTRQEQAQLAAAQAQLELTRLNLGRAQGLVDQGVVARADYDRAVAEHRQAEARVGEIEATIDRKQIRAPFSGLLGIRQANLGQYLNGGDPVVPLQSLDPIYVNFSVPQQDGARLRAGSDVRIEAEGAGSFSGQITAVDSVVDEATRNVQAQATFRNPAGRLRPGMFVKTQVGLAASAAVVALPASAISYAPYGDSVFVVEEMKGANGESYRGARQQFVKLGAARGDQVSVLAGVAAGEQIVSSGVFKLRNGVAVKIDNDVQPANDPAPRPEDN